MKTKHRVTFQRSADRGVVELQTSMLSKTRLAFLFDATGSSEDESQRLKTIFAKQMADLNSQAEKLRGFSGVKVRIGFYTGADVTVGKFVPLDKVPEELEKINFFTGRSNIAGGMEKIQNGWFRRKAHGVVLIADTADGDSEEKLRNTGSNLETPIVALYNETRGTDEKDKSKFHVLSEASGVEECPIAFEKASYKIVENNRAILPFGWLGRKWKIPFILLLPLLGFLVKKCPRDEKPVDPLPPIVVKVPPDLKVVARFGFDSAKLAPDVQGDLGAFAAQIKGSTKGHMSIQGHASEEGANAYNLALSAKRATAVAAFLKSQGVQISADIQALGEQGATLATHDQDRNVTVVFQPSQP